MAIPNIQALMVPFLRLLADGKEHSVGETEPLLAEYFKLTARELNSPLVKGKKNAFKFRFGWTRTRLKQAGLIEAKRRGVFKITGRGLQVLSTNPTFIDKESLRPIVESSTVQVPSRVDHLKRQDSRDSKTGHGVRKLFTMKKCTAPKAVKYKASSTGKYAKRSSIDTVKKPQKLPVTKKIVAGPLLSYKLKLRSESIKTTNHRVVDVFFGTNRAMNSEAVPGRKFMNSRGELRLGVCKVSIPVKHHKMGEIERPKLYRFELKESQDKHIVLLGIETMNEKKFSSNLKLVSKCPVQSAFVFVHGYNVSFEDAAHRTAQIAFDLGLKSVPAFFSWPSQANAKDYIVDAQNVEWTEASLEKFLSIFAHNAEVNEVFVIAHSMGARAVTRAVANLLRNEEGLRSKFREIILAAPDIDADVFKDVLLPALVASQQNVTIYASSNDRALNYSKKINGAQRAGDSKPLPVVASGLETIDASKVKTDYFGHSYVIKERTLLTDLALLLNNKIRAALRPTLEAVQVKSGTYWSFKA